MDIRFCLIKNKINDIKYMYWNYSNNISSFSIQQTKKIHIWLTFLNYTNKKKLLYEMVLSRDASSYHCCMRRSHQETHHFILGLNSLSNTSYIMNIWISCLRSYTRIIVKWSLTIVVKNELYIVLLIEYMIYPETLTNSTKNLNFW